MAKFAAYLKQAFINRWNLLVFGGAMGFALLSGRADVFAPLVLASEVAYLGLLGTHPKFQAYVNAQAAKQVRRAGAESSEKVLAKVVRKLPRRSLERFEELRARCLELQQIAWEIKSPGAAGSPPPLEQLQHAGLDKLLWIYLRLLFTEYSLERFLKQTPGERIEADIAGLEARLSQLDKVRDAAQQQKMRRTLEDNLRTCQDRLANYHKARDNHELVRLELDRLENKIRALSEMAVNRQEPDYVSTQVDAVAESMLQTERTMNDLQFATGLEMVDETVPPLLQRGTLVTKG